MTEKIAALELQIQQLKGLCLLSLLVARVWQVLIE